MKRKVTPKKGTGRVLFGIILVLVGAIWYVGETRHDWNLLQRLESEKTALGDPQPEGVARDVSFLGQNLMLVPMREGFEAAGGEVAYEKDTGLAVATIGETRVSVNPGTTTARINRTVKPLRQRLVMVDGSLYVPVALLNEAVPQDVEVALMEEPQR